MQPGSIDRPGPPETWTPFGLIIEVVLGRWKLCSDSDYHGMIKGEESGVVGEKRVEAVNIGRSPRIS